MLAWLHVVFVDPAACRAQERKRTAIRLKTVILIIYMCVSKERKRMIDVPLRLWWLCAIQWRRCVTRVRAGPWSWVDASRDDDRHNYKQTPHQIELTCVNVFNVLPRACWAAAGVRRHNTVPIAFARTTRIKRGNGRQLQCDGMATWEWWW